MKNMVQIKVSNEDFNEIHEKKLSSVLSRVQEIVPENTKVEGRIVGVGSQYEGQIHIRSRIGAFVVKAKAQNMFSLIAKLQVKIMRQIVNWREKRFSKKRYQRRKQKLELVANRELA